MKPAIFIILLLLLTGSPVPAGPWQFAGLSGEEISTIAIDPGNDSIVYVGTMSNFSAGTYGSINKSSDAGENWNRLVYGVTVTQIVINSSDSREIYAALAGANFTIPGILKSTDGGMNWFKSDSGISLNWETYVQTIAIDPFNPETLYAGTGGFFGGSFYKSTDSGEFWENIGLGLGLMAGVICTRLDPQTPDIVHASTAWTCYFYKSWDGGQTWREIIPPFDGLVYSFAINPTNPDILYAASQLCGLFKSLDGGLTWFRVESGIPTPENAGDVLIDPTDPEVVYAGVVADGVFYSRNAGANWSPMNSGLNNKSIDALAITPDGKTLYAGTSDGIYKCSVDPLTITKPPGQISEFKLYANYPNPFNSRTTISYDISEQSFVNLTIYNLSGQKIKELVNSPHPAGQYKVFWGGTNEKGNPVSSGVYIYSLESKAGNYTKKMIYLK